MSQAKRRATYEDLMTVPDWKVAEIIDGELIVTPRPPIPHARANAAMGSGIHGSFDGPPGDPDRPGGWWILFEPELHFGDDVLVPDQAGWRRDRLAVLPNAPFITQPPDWICEVLSPSTATVDRARKMPIYAREGVAHLWFVDPIVRILEVYRLERGFWVVVDNFGGDDRVRAEPFEAIELALERWWLPAAPAA